MLAKYESVAVYFIFYFINFASQAGRAPQQLGPITVAPFFTLPTMILNRRQTTTPGNTCPTLSDKCVGSFTSHRIINIEGLWDGTSGLSSLSEKTWKSNGDISPEWVLSREQMSRRRKSDVFVGVEVALTPCSRLGLLWIILALQISGRELQSCHVYHSLVPICITAPSRPVML